MTNAKQSIEEAIKLAQEATAGTDPALRANAFEVVLNHLLNGQDKPSKPEGKKTSSSAADSKDEATSDFDAVRVSEQLGITEEQIEDLYEIKADTLFLHTKPSGQTLPKQRQSLAQILMVGYKYGFGAKNVPQSKILKAADEWNISGAHFSRDINKSKYVQSKAGGKGTDPTLTLAPGSIDDIIADVKALLNI